MGILYREALASDAEALIEYTKTVGAETDNLSHGAEGVPCSLERQVRFIERFLKSKEDLMLLALCDGRIVANASISRNRIPRYSHRAELSITVLAEFWGQQIGSTLMEMLIAHSKSTGVRVINLEVRADNFRAISLYKKYGFCEIGISKDFFKIKKRFFDALLMQLCI